jgi:hypothetical protein
MNASAATAGHGVRLMKTSPAAIRPNAACTSRVAAVEPTSP